MQSNEVLIHSMRELEEIKRLQHIEQKYVIILLLQWINESKQVEHYLE